MLTFAGRAGTTPAMCPSLIFHVRPLQLRVCALAGSTADANKSKRRMRRIMTEFYSWRDAPVSVRPVLIPLAIISIVMLAAVLSIVVVMRAAPLPVPALVVRT